MIPSKYIIHLLEEFLTQGKGWQGSVGDIFVNPTSNDYNKLHQDGAFILRFIADPNSKKVYVANADKLYHIEIARNANILSVFKSDALFGEAILNGTRAVMKKSDGLESRLTNLTAGDIDWLDYFFTRDWSWLNKYIDSNNYLDKIKKQLGQRTKHLR